VGAYQGTDSVTNLLSATERAIENHKVSAIDITCKHHPVPQTGPEGSQLCLRVDGCLAHLGESAYLSLAALGLAQVFVRVDACDTCPWVDLKANIQQQIENAQKLLSALGGSAELTLISGQDDDMLLERPGWNAESPPLSRAELFKAKTFLSKSETISSLSAESAKIGNDQLSDERKRRIAALALLPRAGSPQTKGDSLDGECSCMLSISEACNACAICAKGCPTAALKFLHDQGQYYALYFYPLVCIGCKICIKLCPEQAISDSQTELNMLVSEQTRLVMKSGRLKRCKKCNQLIADKDEILYCSACAIRAKNPFSFRLPPGYKIEK
jgi:ferredoxin